MVPKNLENRNEVLYAKLVPGSGHADTLEGEMLRAINKIVYRYYNDGDYYHKDYGVETAGPAHAFLLNLDYSDGYDRNNKDLLELQRDLFKILDPDIEPYGKDYEDSLISALYKILNYIESREKSGYKINKYDMLHSEPLFENYEADDDDQEYDWDYDHKYGYAKGGKITIKDIEKSWDKNYGEDFKEEYSGLYNKLKKEKNLSAQKLDKLWDETYGEDFKEEYGGVYEELNKFARGGKFPSLRLSDFDEDIIENTFNELVYNIDEVIDRNMSKHSYYKNLPPEEFDRQIKRLRGDFGEFITLNTYYAKGGKVKHECGLTKAQVKRLIDGWTWNMNQAKKDPELKWEYIALEGVISDIKTLSERNEPKYKNKFAKGGNVDYNEIKKEILEERGFTEEDFHKGTMSTKEAREIMKLANEKYSKLAKPSMKDLGRMKYNKGGKSKTYVDNSDYMEFISEVAYQITYSNFQGDPFVVNKGDGYTQFTDEAQDFYNEKYDLIETYLNRILNVYPKHNLMAKGGESQKNSTRYIIDNLHAFVNEHYDRWDDGETSHEEDLEFIQEIRELVK